MCMVTLVVWCGCGRKPVGPRPEGPSAQAAHKHTGMGVCACAGTRLWCCGQWPANGVCGEVRCDRCSGPSMGNEGHVRAGEKGGLVGRREQPLCLCASAWQPPRTRDCMGKMCAVDPRSPSSLLGESKEVVENDAQRGVEDSAITCQGGGEEKGDIVDIKETKKHMSWARGRQFFLFLCFFFSSVFVQARFRGPKNLAPALEVPASQTNRGGKRRPGKACGQPGWDRFVHPRGPFALLWPALFPIAIFVTLSPGLKHHATTPTTQRTHHPHLVHCPFQPIPPAPCRWARRLSGPPKLTYL